MIDQRFVLDAAQDAMIEIERRWEERRGLRYDPARDNYLLKVARRKLVDYLENPRNKMEAFTSPSSEASDDGLLGEWLVKHLDFMRLIKQLPPQQREALFLHKILDRSQADVAKIMGVRKGTIKTYIERAMAALEQQPQRKIR